MSVDYLAKPLDVFKEMRRVLKPGGLAIMRLVTMGCAIFQHDKFIFFMLQLCGMLIGSFSNRCFWTKAISIWTGTGDVDHVYIVGSYFHYTGGFEPPQASLWSFQLFCLQLDDLSNHCASVIIIKQVML